MHPLFRLGFCISHLFSLKGQRACLVHIPFRLVFTSAICSVSRVLTLYDSKVVILETEFLLSHLLSLRTLTLYDLKGSCPLGWAFDSAICSV